MTGDPLEALRRDFEAHFGRPPERALRVAGWVCPFGDWNEGGLLPLLGFAGGPGIDVAIAGASDGFLRVAAGGEEVALTVGGAEGRPEADLANCAWAVVRGLQDEESPGAAVLLGGEGIEHPIDQMTVVAGIVAGMAALRGSTPKPAVLLRAVIEAGRRAKVPGVEAVAAVQIHGDAQNLVRAQLDPPAVTTTCFPGGWAFAVAVPGHDALDSEADRIIGARLAAAMLSDQVGLEVGNPAALSQIAAVDVVDILVDDLPERISPREVAHGAGADLEQLVRLEDDRLDPNTQYPVRRVARHLLSEAVRVESAVAAAAGGDLVAFGRLLDEAHNSVRQDLRTSSVELDRLCAAMRKGGAAGARAAVSSAGLVAIALVRAEDSESVMLAAGTAGAARTFLVTPSVGVAWL